jgi:PAS domain S-box-containing protein
MLEFHSEKTLRNSASAMPGSPFSPIALGPDRLKISPRHWRWHGYSVALGSVSLVVVLSLVFKSFLHGVAPFSLFFPAITLSALYGGLGPAIFAVLLSVLAVDLFFLPPMGQLLVSDPANIVRMCLFSLSALLVGILSSSLERAWRRSEINAYEVSRQVQRFRHSEERYRRMFETAYEGIWSIDADGMTNYVNHRMVEMLGSSILGMVGRPMIQFALEEDQARLKTVLTRIAKGGREVFDFRFRRKDGSLLYCIVSTQAIFDTAGNCAGSLNMVTDITQRRMAEQDVVHALDAIKGQVQDVRGMADTMLTETETVLEELPEDHAQRRALEPIRDQASQVVAMTKSMLSTIGEHIK